MKKLLNTLLTFIILSSGHVSAIEISTQLAENAQGELEKQVTLLCDAHETKLCNSLCGDPLFCVRPEKICTDCVGLKNQSLRTAFTDLPFLYRREGHEISNEGILGFLKENQFMLISADSYLNIFNANKKEQIKAQFQAFCPGSELSLIRDTLLIASLNPQSQVNQFIGVVCTTLDHVSSIYPLKYNPEYSLEKIDYWKNEVLNPEHSLEMDQHLNLKLDLTLGKIKTRKHAKKLRQEQGIELKMTLP